VPLSKSLALVALAIVACASIFTACSDDDDEESDGATASPAAATAPSVSGDVTVFAAASLTAAFTEIGEAFEDANPDAVVTFNFGGSQDLRTQLEQGAGADAFASADTKQMDMAVASGVVADDSEVFAHNRLVVIVPKSNAAGIETLDDLTNPGAKLVLANTDVPVGSYSRQFLDKASADPTFGADYKDNVLANLVSEEGNVKQVVAKVQLDEADIGIVYSSDVTPEVSEDVTKIDIPDAYNVIATYPIALTSEPGNKEAAQAFIDFVLSDTGQKILVSHGFIAVES
jgi:molybdate transport system substrate-binding protein